MLRECLKNFLMVKYSIGKASCPAADMLDNDFSVFPLERASSKWKFHPKSCSMQHVNMFMIAPLEMQAHVCDRQVYENLFMSQKQ